VLHRLLSHLLMAAGLAAGASSVPAQKPAPTAPAGPQPIARASFILQMDAQFRQMDADRNGQLTRIEIEQFQKLQAVADAKDRNRALFVQLDADKSGQLSATEFSKLMSAPPTADATPMLTREDGNRDQKISLVEHRAATLANFDRIDADKDGVVTAAEMKAGGIAPR